FCGLPRAGEVVFNERVLILKNDGKGRFRRHAVQIVPASSNAEPLRAFLGADWSGDGLLDLMALFGSESGQGIWLLQGLGDGTFASPRLLESRGANSGGSMAALDAEGDGDLDLVTEAGILFLNQDGKFVRGVDVPAGKGGLAVGDFDRDGDEDIAWPSRLTLN